MLVLSRKVGEPVIVNDNVCVTVTAVHGNRVQLEFSAPKEVSIRRQELERLPQTPRKKRRQSGLSAAIVDCEVAMNQSAIDRRRKDDKGIAIEQLEALLRSRLNGRVCDLRVVKSSAGIVLQGRATTFYAKQLAQHEFMKATARPLLANEILVPEQSISPQHFIQ